MSAKITPWPIPLNSNRHILLTPVPIRKRRSRSKIQANFIIDGLMTTSMEKGALSTKHKRKVYQFSL
eukprot:Pgem_evm2s7077